MEMPPRPYRHPMSSNENLPPAQKCWPGWNVFFSLTAAWVSSQLPENSGADRIARYFPQTIEWRKYEPRRRTPLRNLSGTTDALNSFAPQCLAPSHFAQQPWLGLPLHQKRTP